MATVRWLIQNVFHGMQIIFYFFFIFSIKEAGWWGPDLNVKFHYSLGAHAPLKIAPVSEWVSESGSQWVTKKFERAPDAWNNPLWSRMVPYGTVWSLMVPYGHLWSLMVPYGPIWPRIVPYGPIMYCMVLYGTVWHQMVLFGPVWSCLVPLVLYGTIRYQMVQYGTKWSCMLMYGSI